MFGRARDPLRTHQIAFNGEDEGLKYRDYDGLMNEVYTAFMANFDRLITLESPPLCGDYRIGTRTNAAKAK